MDENHVGVLDCLVDVVFLEMGDLHEIATEDGSLELLVGVELVFLQMEIVL